MQQANVINLTQYRVNSNKVKRRSKPKGRGKGGIYSRGNKLWVDFRYLGKRVREPSGLDDTRENRKLLRHQLDLIIAEIDNGLFEFAKRFPHSRKKVYFAALEGRILKKDPKDVIFGDYLKKWLQDMTPGMSLSKIRDYRSTLNCHIIPYFGKMPMGEIFTRICLKKFVAHLKGKKNPQGNPLSAKRIQNVLIPLRAVLEDAADEFGWYDLPDPFVRLKLPKVKRIQVYPFSFDEWQFLMTHIPKWYRNYFEFAVQTGLRPSEQVALKWEAVDGRFIYIERSRVRNREKEELKNEYSRRMIEIRPAMRKVLKRQWGQTKQLMSPYVFVTSIGTPIIQDRLREQWAKAMRASSLRYRRMYETRHTFASWALAAGELPGWVAQTLGHVDTSMVYRTYGRFIRNLTRQDGSAFEKLYTDATKQKSSTKVCDYGHNLGHNRKNERCYDELSN